MVTQVPDTKYARNGDVRIAYQVLGTGPIDIVHVPPVVSHLEFQWEDPLEARYFRRLASFSRLIMFDKRGTGLSDRVGVGTLEERMDDVRAVMNSAGSERAAIFGNSEGGALSLLFAATYPDRVTALVLYGAYPRLAWAPDYPNGILADGMVEQVLETWGQGALGLLLSNSGASDDPASVAAMARWERLSSSPSDAAAIFRMIMNIDVRHVVPSISVPTLVLYRPADEAHAVGSRYLGEQIPGAKVVELPGDCYFPHLGDQDAITSEVEHFLTGVRPPVDPDRALATVLFTDIVGSTEHAARLGDRRWAQTLDDHDAIVAAELDRHRGRKVNPTGDGILATFDGPARAVLCGQAICRAVRPLGIEVRAGLHTGEVELRGDDIGGIAVHIGARVAALAGPGEVLVSRTVTDLVAGSGIDFVDRGTYVLKGVPGEWTVFAVASSRARTPSSP
jgi:class 3 adenylate cyclase/pimeloyl-ACP methyl ester carboxylesterase